MINRVLVILDFVMIQ